VSWLQLVFESDRTRVPALEDALLEIGALSVTLQDSADEPVFEPGVGETPLWQATRVLALFEIAADATQQAIDAQVAALIDALQQQVPLPAWRAEQLQDQVWERAWMADFQPMRFGQRLWICPSWAEPPDPAGVVLALDPGLAFGTGTHPTTALCLEWLDSQPLQGCTVVDYGCGSGILGIAALLLGAQRVIAVDNDPQALVATRANAERNHITPERLITCLPGQLPDDSAADVMVANILAGPLQSLAPLLIGLTLPGGRLALSGILAEQAEDVAAAYRSACALAPITQRAEWVRIDGVRKAGE
jgi:ribosomal protein L11 methyltransferase